MSTLLACCWLIILKNIGRFSQRYPKASAIDQGPTIKARTATKSQPREGEPQAWRDVNYAVIIMWDVRGRFALTRIVVRGTNQDGNLA
jgi:hypothetical protein